MIGAPLNRVDGPKKVTGTATYSYEDWSLGQPLYGVIAGATIGFGRIKQIDTRRAEQAPGVWRVFTHRDQICEHFTPVVGFDRYRTGYPVMASADIRYFGDPVALAIATTLEQARAAADLVDVEYEKLDGRFDFHALAGEARLAKAVNAGFPAETQVGDFDGAFERAPVKIDQQYTTPYELSQPLELHGCVARWNGKLLELHVSTQIVSAAHFRIATTLGLDPAQVRIVSHYVGGGFGSKLGLHAEAILAAIAARELGQPVKISATRQQTFLLIGNRAATRQRVRLGANRDGTLTAFGHDVVMKASVGDDYHEQTATSGRGLYAAPNRRTVHMGVDLNLMFSEDVRAPGEAPGLLAIESAVDELAHELDMDPIELRIKNEPRVHPELNLPWSQRRLVECYREGAARFGWDRRPKKPGTARDGAFLVGWGMAAAIRPHFQFATTVAVRLEPDGTAIVRSDMTDIGTGTYTILTQIAAEALGYPVDRIRVELGDSTYPPSGGSGGSWGATNSATATHRACLAVRDKVRAAVDDKASALPLAELVTRHFPSGVEATGSIKSQWDEPSLTANVANTYGAHFAEVHVDVHTAEIRVRRMLGVFDAGRIFNAKTARSQLIGGMIWGISAALHEEAVIDPRYGSFINRDFAQYLVPVHADIPAVEAIFLDGFDDKANELGAKGIGELGTCGSAAAIANAVFNATGVRVRDLPITVEKLLTRIARNSH